MVSRTFMKEKNDMVFCLEWEISRNFAGVSEEKE